MSRDNEHNCLNLFVISTYEHSTLFLIVKSCLNSIFPCLSFFNISIPLGDRVLKGFTFYALIKTELACLD